MNDFYRTRMGHTFFESTMPRIATALEKIGDALQRVAEHAERAEPPMASARGGETEGGRMDADAVSAAEGPRSAQGDVLATRQSTRG